MATAADETEDLGRETLLEGSEDIMSGIDEVMNRPAPEVEKPAEVIPEREQVETPEAKEEAERVERARNEKGQFEKTQREEKEKADKLAKEQAAPEAKDKEYPAEIKSPKAREHFDTVKKLKEDAERRASSAEAKLKQSETKVQELESKSGTAAPEVKVLQQQLADLQAQLDDRERIISFKAVEETKPFREGVTEPMSAAEQTMDEIAGQYGLDISQINKVLAEPNKYKRGEMLADLTESLPERSAFVRGDLKTAVDNWIAADGKRAELYQNAKGNRDFAEQEKQQTEAKAALERQQAHQKANKEVDDILKEKFPEIAGDETTWNGITEKAFKVADFDRMPAKAKAFANLSSWMIMPVMEKLRAEITEHQKTKDILAKRSVSDPSPAGGRGGVGGKVEGEDDYDPNNPLGGLLSGIDSTLAGG